MRKPKKCETLEIRLPYEAKRAFMDRCRDEGRSASEALREYIEGYVQPQRASRPSCGAFRWVAAGLSALAVGATAVPSFACPLHRAAAEHLGVGGLDAERHGNRESQAFGDPDAKPADGDDL
jgi:hypothetical protein